MISTFVWSCVIADKCKTLEEDLDCARRRIIEYEEHKRLHETERRKLHNTIQELKVCYIDPIPRIFEIVFKFQKTFPDTRMARHYVIDWFGFINISFFVKFTWNIVFNKHLCCQCVFVEESDYLDFQRQTLSLTFSL